MTRTELKSTAKDNLAQKYKEALIALIVVWLGTFAVTFILELITKKIGGISTIVAVFITAPFSVGVASVYLNIAKHGDGTWINVFDGFKIFTRSFLLYILKYVFVTLWSLLFLIPGIVAAFRYSMAEYILCDNPDMSPIEAIRESKRIMEGKKFDLFVLYLSFAWWYILGIITCGIAYIWVIPYVKATVANFYLSVKAEKEYTYFFNANNTNNTNV